MWARAILVLALATALRGVPSIASAADGSAAEPSLDGAVTLAAGAAAVTIGGVVLVVARRRRPGGPIAIEAERRIEATEERVTAALTRRTLHRGRLRFDDDVVAGSRGAAPSPKSTSRVKRRTG